MMQDTEASDTCAFAARGGSPSVERLGAPRQFAPRANDGLEGVLITARSAATRDRLGTLVLPTLTELVRLAIDWPTDEEAPDARIGDYRFLILEFTPTNGILRFAQIWSEPRSELLMEVGPGQREDSKAQALADLMAPALHGRGFVIGGNADNFRKRLAIPRTADAPAIAAELLSLIADVLDFDGSVDLAYQLRQSSFLRSDYVTSDVARSGLQDLLGAWGLSTTIPQDDLTTLDAHSHGFDFQLRLFAPVKGKRETFWEIHLLATFPIPRERISDLLDEVNDKAWLMKACAGADRGQATVPVRFSYGINLAGGVSLAHIKSQVFEWLDAVHHLWATWRTPIPNGPTTPAEPTPHTVH